MDIKILRPISLKTIDEISTTKAMEIAFWKIKYCPKEVIYDQEMTVEDITTIREEYQVWLESRGFIKTIPAKTKLSPDDLMINNFSLIWNDRPMGILWTIAKIINGELVISKGLPKHSPFELLNHGHIIIRFEDPTAKN